MSGIARRSSAALGGSGSFREHAMATPQSKDELAKWVTDTVQETSAQLHKIYEPQWNARTDVLKTLVSLSSGSIVLSVTFSTSIRAAHLNPNWRYVILFSFVMFVLSLVIALAALWIGTRVYEMQSSNFDARKPLHQAVLAANTYDEFMAAFTDIQNRAIKPIANNDRWANRLYHVCSITFCLAIASLAIVGIRELLQ